MSALADAIKLVRRGDLGPDVTLVAVIQHREGYTFYNTGSPRGAVESLAQAVLHINRQADDAADGRFLPQ